MVASAPIGGRRLAASAIAAFCMGITSTKATACAVALALAVDVSGSVDAREYRIQMDGLAEALRDGLVAEALVREEASVMLMQWTGDSRQRVTIPWVQIKSFADVENFAARVAADERIWRNYSTAIGEALTVLVPEFDAVFFCRRHVIDVSGDGASNEGIEPTEVRPLLDARGIIVNALVIETDPDSDLTAYFWENVITGEGAFVATAQGFDDYPVRMRAKLIREITRQVAAIPHASFPLVK